MLTNTNAENTTRSAIIETNINIRNKSSEIKSGIFFVHTSLAEETA
jgi:hypothetical protein